MNVETKQSAFMSASLLSFTWSHRKQLMIICLLALLSSTIVAYLLPVKYKATTIVFASDDNNISKTLLTEDQYRKDYLAFGDEKDCEQMLQILRSNSVMQAINKKYNLLSYYGIADRPDKYTILKDWYFDNFSFEITEYQSIKVEVYDAKPEIAAAMANSVVDFADSIFRQIVNQRAIPAFNIVKRQYDSTNRQLLWLEDSMNFFRKQGMLDYMYEVKELIRGYADAEVKGTPASIEAIENRLKPFELYGKQYATIYNDLFSGYKWMQQLKINYIQAKADAENYIPAVFVADKAVAPDKKTYPIRWLVVSGSTLAAFFFGLITLLIINRFRQNG